MPQSNSPRILLVDKDLDRKERIGLLKKNGFTVYPALDVQQARERCKPGRYDLIIVNAGDDQHLALALCDHIASQDPRQRLLLMAAPDIQLARREHVVSSKPEALLERVQALLSGHYSEAKSLAA
jgi:DNA-binding response OmpR family regulator